MRLTPWVIWAASLLAVLGVQVLLFNSYLSATLTSLASIQIATRLRSRTQSGVRAAMETLLDGAIVLLVVVLFRTKRFGNP